MGLAFIEIDVKKYFLFYYFFSNDKITKENIHYLNIETKTPDSVPVSVSLMQGIVKETS